MNEIIALTSCLEQSLPGTRQRQLARIVTALLTMTGRVTMLGISRWTEKGGSYRTVQRFFHTVISWLPLFWLFFRHHLYEPGHEYLLAGDESIVTKSGKETYGLDRFFSSLYGKPVPGLAFFALSLIDVQNESSSPIMVEQVIRTEEEKQKAKAKKRKKKQSKGLKKRGRPKGSKNKDKTQVEWTAELLQINGMTQKVLQVVLSLIPLKYMVLDGHFGNNHALQMVRQCGLHLISKLRYDSALYFLYEGEQKAKGPDKRYGKKIDYQHIPDLYLLKSFTKKQIRTEIYQAQMLHKSFADLLNVVIIVKYNLQTQKRRHVILFSSDLTLSAEKIIHYYSLRFQIEFNFRDAKQFWGMEDFMALKETAVINAVSLSLFMVSVSQRLLHDFRRDSSNAGVLDLKAHFRGRKYAAETIKMLPQKPNPILLQRIFHHIASLGRIHDPQIPILPT